MTSFGPAADRLAAWIQSLGVPGSLASWGAILLLVLAPTLGLIFPIAGVAQYFERKIAALAQRRKGPMVGADGVVRLVIDLVFFWKPRWQKQALQRTIENLPLLKPVLAKVRQWGLGSIAADGVKMFLKEDMVPAGADRFLFHASTYLVMLGGFLAYVVFPFSQGFHVADYPVGALFLGAVTGLVAVSILNAGWSSNNKWSHFGGIRAVAMIVSYETPIALCIAAVVMWSGTMSLQGIVAAQYHEGWLSFLGWNLFQTPLMVLLAGVYYLSGLAECNRAPFDLSEGESEIVGGFHTEYSGLRWGLFFIAEYADMMLVGGLFATLFLGGYQSPIGEQWIVSLPQPWEAVVHTLIMATKFVLSVGFMMWIRWTLPRFRIDQVMRLAWTKLVPLALFVLFGLAVTQLVFANLNGTVRITHGEMISAPVVSLGAMGIGLSWLLVGGAMVVLVVLAKRYGEPRPMDAGVQDALTGSGTWKRTKAEVAGKESA
ncbi:MAG: NADH-quinone oxidoreductase subunit H [Fibrobacteria bacterium]|nr:NADH-quinone oxidoreductase subunit H [Fibrobacteria bacterium]